MLHDDGHTKEENAPSSEGNPLMLEQGLRILARVIARHLRDDGPLESTRQHEEDNGGS